MSKSRNLKTIICRDLWGKKKRVAVSKLAFRPSVYGVIIRNNKVLLSPQFDSHNFPGGGIHLGETIDEALAREVWEETGLRVTKGELLLVQEDFFIHPKTGKYFHTILLFYTCTNPRGKISTAHFDAYERQYAGKAEWVPIVKALKLKFYNPIDSPALIREALKVRA